MITKYVQTGLIISFTDFYDEIQDNAIANLQEFLSIVCKTPGVKVADEEFECSVDRGVLKVDIGQAVFPNYVPFFPGTERHVELDLSTINQLNEYEVVFQLTADDVPESHPYPFVPIGNPDPAETPQSMRHYAMEYRATRIIVREEEAPDNYTLQLARLYYDNGWVIEDMRTQLELVKPLSFDGHDEPNLLASSTNLSKLRHVPEGRADITINNQSDITNIAPGSRAIVSWDPMDEMGFYIARIHIHIDILAPDGSDLLSQSRLIFHYGGTERIYTSIPCANGVDYIAKLFYSPSLLNPRFVNLGEANFRGGAQNYSDEIATPATSYSIEYLYNTSRIIRYTPGEIPSNAELMKVYIYDRFEGDDAAPPTLPYQYLYKEMSPGPFTYFASEDSVDITIEVVFCDGGQQNVAHSSQQTIELSREPMNSNQLVIPIFIPDDDDDAVGEETIYEMTAWRNFVIDRIRVVGTGDSQSGDDTLDVKDGDGNVRYSVDFDEYNNGVAAFSGSDLYLFEEDDDIEFTISNGADLRGSTIYLTVRVVE